MNQPIKTAKNVRLIGQFVTASATTFLPVTLISLVYLVALDDRRDYVGHFAAGFGGTLCAITALLALISARSYERLNRLVPLLCTVACIGLGAIAEATVFKLAKFDEIDFCNQSLGAALAGLATAPLLKSCKPADWHFTLHVAIGLAFLVIGSYYALT